MSTEFEVGSVVLVTAGKEKGLLFAVVGFSNERLLVCDGRTRRFNKPKTKSAKHLVNKEIILCEDAMRSNQKLRRSLAALHK